MSELNVLYDVYMDQVEEQIAADGVLHAAEAEMRATPQYRMFEAAQKLAADAAALTASALAAVKEAVGAAFNATGERQPHPYAGIIRVDTKARYNEANALAWVKARPDYAHLVVPESLDKRGFEKLARNLEASGVTVGVIDEWIQVPVVSVRPRED